MRHLVIDTIPIYDDNYVWIIIHPEQNQAYIVDPGDSLPVLDFLKQNKLTLAGILVTHRHWDHVTGIADIIATHPVKVYGPEHKDIPWVSHTVTEGSAIVLWQDVTVEVWSSPGHLPEQVNYLLKTYEGDVFFGGDTLFSCGCSRIFDGTPQELKGTLDRIANLPADTPICTSHEYTLANIDFAEAIEPQNKSLLEYKKKAQALRADNRPTLPTNSKQEKEVNPFLRCTNETVIKAVEKHTGKKMLDDLAVFTALRQWKDTF